MVRLEYLQGPTSHAAADVNRDDLSATPVSQSLTVNHPRIALYNTRVPGSHLTFCNAEHDLILCPGGDGGARGMARACGLLIPADAFSAPLNDHGSGREQLTCSFVLTSGRIYSSSPPVSRLDAIS